MALARDDHNHDMANDVVKLAGEKVNHLSLNIDGKTPLSKWFDTNCQIFVKELHTWGCHASVLDGLN